MILTSEQKKAAQIAGGLLAIFLLLGGCNLPAPTACPDGVVCIPVTGEPTVAIPITPDVGNTAEPSATPTASATAYPTLIPTATLSPELYTPTAIIEWQGGEELLGNPGFEDGFRTIIVGDCNELGEDGKPKCEPHIVAQDWQIAYLAPNSHYELVAPPDPNSDTPQGRPEAKPMDIPSRVHSGSLAQYAFCAYETCTVAFYQVVELTPGDTCQLSANVQLWIAGGYDELGRGRDRGIVGWEGEPWTDGSIPILHPEKYTSDIATEDDRKSASVKLFASMAGDQNAFTESRLESRPFGWLDHIYDQYNELSYRFTVSTAEVMVGVQFQSYWRHAHNDFMLDDVSLTCIGD